MITRIKARFKTTFLAGLLFITPVGFTLFVLTFLFKKLDTLFTPLLEKTLLYFVWTQYVGYHVPGLGFIVAVVLILLVGFLTTNIIGTRLVNFGERIVERIPVVRSLYAGAKQVIESVASSQTGAFRQVVLLEYPRKGLYCLGLITCENSGEVQRKTDQDVLNVFIPTTPNPTSGYLLFVPRDQLTYLDMSVEEGLKLIVSGGIVAPNQNSGKNSKRIPREELPSLPK